MNVYLVNNLKYLKDISAVLTQVRSLKYGLNEKKQY